MEKVLLLGDEEKAKYHPLSNVSAGIRQALSGRAEVEVCTGYDALEAGRLKAYGLVVDYIDRFDLVGDFAARLEGYVREGGRLLALHNGIITGGNAALTMLLGGTFVTHPSARRLKFTATTAGGALAQGRAFSMPEEPYIVAEVPGVDKHTFLTFDLEGKTMPAGWTLRHGAGNVAYLAPGHGPKTFADPSFQALVKELTAFLLGNR